MKELQFALQMHQLGKEAREFFPVRFHSPTQANRVLPYVKIPQKNTALTLNRAMKIVSNNNCAVIYIHIPFCSKICDFCGYNRITTDNHSTYKRYTNTILSHIEQASRFEWASKKSISAIYFGGGTPSVLYPSFIGDILHKINKSFVLAPDCEVTVESTITDLTENHLKLYNEFGMNRLSIGVQSFDTDLRKGIGRLADKQEIMQLFERLPRYNFRNICMDLIYNLENQTIETWIDDLNQINDLPVTGCSIYPLILHPGSALFKEKTGIPQNKKLEMQYFLTADTFFQNLTDWDIITPVQYGHAKDSTARYIQLQGQNTEMLAFGPGAMGKINGMQYLIHTNIDEFIKQKYYINSNISVFQIKEQFHKLSLIYVLSNNLFIPASTYKAIEPHFDDIIEALHEINLIVCTHDGFKLTQTGRFWAANISHIFSKRISELLV